MKAVETRALLREYPDRRRGSAAVVTALAGVDLTIETGEVRGLLGPNGAGKTTLCKILSTVLLPTAGNASVLGHDVVSDTAAVKRSIGVVFGGDRGLYGRLTARQNLRFWGTLYGLGGTPLRRRVDAILERVGLADRADERVDRFSRGMKQRLHLARGLVADPPVLVLDEPTAGMDPVAAHDFRSLVSQLRADGRTVLLTTHDMNEATAVCDQVTLIDGGAILLTGPPDRVGEVVSRYTRVDAAGIPAGVPELLRAIDGVVSVTATGADAVRAEIDGVPATQRVLAVLTAHGVTEVATGRPTLEEVYLHLIGDRGMTVKR